MYVTSHPELSGPETEDVTYKFSWQPGGEPLSGYFVWERYHFYRCFHCDERRQWSVHHPFHTEEVNLF
jgi:hypothetical protein